MAQLALTDQQKIQIASANGIIRADEVFALAKKTGIPFYIGCAYLEQETSGGKNVFGSDEGPPGKMRGIEMMQPENLGSRDVTEMLYKVYRMQRPDLGAQGVGPLQATYPDWQDEIDRAGGCWVWEVNVEKGFELIMEFKATRTWDQVALRWNGGTVFVDHNRELRQEWRDRLNG